MKLTLGKFLLSISLVYVFHWWGQSWRRGIKCDCKIDWLWVWSPLDEMKYLFIFIFPFSSLWCRGKARRRVPPLNTQSLQNSAESRERSVITLGYGIKREADITVHLTKYKTIYLELLSYSLAPFYHPYPGFKCTPVNMNKNSLYREMHAHTVSAMSVYNKPQELRRPISSKYRYD